MTTLKAYLQPNIDLYLIAALAFLLPVGTKIIPYVIGALCIYRLIEWNWKGYAYWLAKKEVLCFVGFYLLHVVGLLWTSNIQSGLFDIQVKLSLLVMPLVMIPTAGYSKEQMHLILRAFIIGCLVGTVVILSVACFRYLQTGQNAVFFYGQLSIFMHPGYFAMLLNFGIALLLFYLFSGDREVKRRYVILSIFILAITIALLVSRTGIITLLAMLFTAAFYYAVRFKRYLHGMIILLLSVVTVWVFYQQSTLFQARFTDLFEQNSSNSPEELTGRSAIWNASFNAIRKSPIIGFGTGDVKETILTEYKNIEFEKGIEKKLNAHNQFLQSSLALGLVGSVLLLLTWLLPLFRSVGYKNYIYTGFLFIIIVNLLTEAMLERQVGVVFYAFFNSLLFYNVNQNQLLEED